jgi:hypothetical protein
VQHASTQATGAEPRRAPDRDSLSHLFLDVSRKLGKLATSQMDELAQKHLGKPLDELLDGTAVRKSLFETLKAFNEKLDNQNAQSRRRFSKKTSANSIASSCVSDAKSASGTANALQRQEQQRERERSRIESISESSFNSTSSVCASNSTPSNSVCILHRQHQREIRRQQEEHESAAKSIAKNLHERAKAAKREMRRFHNEL